MATQSNYKKQTGSLFKWLLHSGANPAEVFCPHMSNSEFINVDPLLSLENRLILHMAVTEPVFSS